MNQPSEGPRASSAAKRRPYSRSDHRARSHEDAHAEFEAGVPATTGAPSSHPLLPKGEAELITTNEQLSSLIEHLRTARLFAYDSEFIGEMTYIPKLCLVQVASAERIALIDPLAEVELRPFWELLCDPAVEKIVHAGDQDIEPVIRILGREPANVFDTQIAAGFATLPYPVSLSKLVQELTGVRIGKGLTFTHWDQRPLSAMQLRYAADDVRYLPWIHSELGKRLDALGHAKWAREECDAQCDASLYGFNPATQYLRVRGSGSLQPKQLSVLRELTIWRDAAARNENVPPRSFLKDEIMTDLARNPVKSLDRLDRIRGLPRPVERDHGQAILDATARGLAVPPDQMPEAARDSELTPSDRFRSDALWATAQCLCAGQQIDSALVGSRQDLSDFFRATEKKEDLSKLRIMTGWRREVLGEPLLAILQGGLGAQVSWTGGTLHVAKTQAAVN